MNVFYIIKQKGYQFEDLNEENQHIVSWLKCLRKDMENFEYQDEDVALAPETIIGKMKQEIADDVLRQVLQNVDVLIADYQICLIENQPDEAESSV